MKIKATIFIGFYFTLFSNLVLANNGEKIQPDNLFPRVSFETPVGKILVELDRSRAPITVNNFLTYAASGAYDGTIFHRVVADFVIQGGGYDVSYQPREQKAPIFNESGNGLKNELHTIAMARENPPHSATNQFYFNMADNESLDPGKGWGYTVFGVVVEGSEILDLIGKAQTHVKPGLGWEDVPVRPIVLKKVTILAEE
ncbi:peptidylprolyl isomerase [Aliikangiella sp. IMCC44359]|uniref:peptidylprolyl isomerase n=1 Tax=Aliikangiella sp. IMCC44359 TaxID=3459125 RepID=UPI00403A9688